MTAEDNSDAPDGVGYGRSLKNSQFPKGKSGNPKGRPKGVKNFMTEIREELNARIPITENGKRKKITKRKAVAKQLVNKAAAGDPKASLVLLNETRPYETDSYAASAQPESMSPEDQMVMESIVRRIREAASGPDPRAPSAQPCEDHSHAGPPSEVEASQ